LLPFKKVFLLGRRGLLAALLLLTILVSAGQALGVGLDLAAASEISPLPLAYFRSGRQPVEAGQVLHSCWPRPGRQGTTCADGAWSGFPTAQLRIEPKSSVTVQFRRGNGAYKSPARSSLEIRGLIPDRQFGTRPGKTVFFDGDFASQTFRAPLHPGKYVVHLNAEWDGRRSASYELGLIVQRSSLPPLGARNTALMGIAAFAAAVLLAGCIRVCLPTSPSRPVG
jgi:hypothetical protein